MQSHRKTKIVFKKLPTLQEKIKHPTLKPDKKATMKYSDFLKELSKILNINLATIHQSIIDAGTDINKHLNPTTLRIIKDKFDHFLMANAIDK